MEVFLDKTRSMDILAISRDDPVVLSNVAVEPGIYKELRLILSDDSIIQVDGEVFDIKIPSGEQSGLKLKGPFEIPRGKLFRLTIDFVASESVIYNKGQGYMLKPVLRISDTSEITGIFRGNLEFSNSLGPCETLLELRANGTARLRIASYPKYTLYADYKYNSSTKTVALTNTELSAPGLNRRQLKQVIKEIPDTIALPIKQWSLDSIIIIDTGGLTCNLYRVDEFNFSPGLTFTEFTLNIDYPDNSKIGKKAVVEIHFIDSGMPSLISLNEFDGNRIIENVEILNSYIQGSSTRIAIISYIFDDENDFNINADISGILDVFMNGSRFLESSNNPWQREKHIFNLQRDGSQTFTVNFPTRLNIELDHTNYPTVLRWDPYPDADNGYVAVIMANNKNNSFHPVDNIGNTLWQVVFHGYTPNNEIKIYSDGVRFIDGYGSDGIIFSPSVNHGDILRAEVFVLDSSGILDTNKYEGALFMDSLNYLYK